MPENGKLLHLYFDTQAPLGLEAAYLAHGQSSRVQQLSEEIAAFAELKAAQSSQLIAVGSLVELTDSAGATRWLFVGPGAAGLTINHDGKSIVVVTASSPAGAGLLNLERNDDTTIGETDYEITSVM